MMMNKKGRIVGIALFSIIMLGLVWLLVTQSIMPIMADFRETGKAIAPLNEMIATLKIAGNDIPLRIESHDNPSPTVSYEGDKLILENENKRIEFSGVENNQEIKIGFDSNAEVNGYVQSYSIDPSSLNFTNATVIVSAIGSELYKCKEWNFTEKECHGSWQKIMDIVPGQEYSFALTAEDPGFGEINATAAYHLDENYGFISDIFAQIEHKDDAWSEPIPENHIVRVSYQRNMTNGNVIDVFYRSSNRGYFEIYYPGTTNPRLGVSANAASEGSWAYISLSNMASPSDVFDFRISGSPIEFDYIHDDDVISPAIALVSPAENYAEISSLIVNFTYNVSDDSNITGCTLYIQDPEGYNNYYSNQTEITKDANQTITAIFQYNGNYKWSVECIDSLENIGLSESRNITVDVPGIQSIITNYTYYLHNESDSQYANYRQMKNVSTDMNSVRSEEVTISNTAAPCWNVSWIASNWTTQTYVNGTWYFNIYTNCSGTALTDYSLKANILKVNSTGLFNLQNSSWITALRCNASKTAKSWSFNVSTLILQPGERAGVKFCATRAGAGTRTTSMYWENVTSSFVRFIALQTTPPSISIVYPANTTYNANVSALNYTVSGASACWYSLNNGANTTIANCANVTGLTSTEGSNTWKVYANDSAGNMNSSSVTFFKDTINPLIQFVSPTNASGITVNRDFILINVTANDTNLQAISIRLYNSSGLINSTYSSNSNLFVNFSSLGNGIYYINATANDSVGNYNSTETRNVTVSVDSIKPSVANMTPAAGSQYYVNETVNITAIVTDNIAVDTVIANITLPNGTILNYRLSKTGSLYNLTFGDLEQKGNYSARITANDSFGNINDSTATNFMRIESIANTTFDVIDSSGQAFSYNQTVLSNISGIIDVQINFTGLNILGITVFGHNESAPLNVIKFSNSTNDSGKFDKVFAIDLSDVDMANATVTLTAIGNTLYKCANYTFSTSTCEDGYDFMQYITPGQTYTFSLNSTDPGFGDQSPDSGTPDAGNYTSVGDGFSSVVNTYTATQADDNTYFAIRRTNGAGVNLDLGAYLNLSYNMTNLTLIGVNASKIINFTFVLAHCYNADIGGAFACGGAAPGGTIETDMPVEMFNYTSGAYQKIGSYNGSSSAEGNVAVSVTSGFSDFISTNNFINIRWKVNVTITTNGNDAAFGADYAPLTVTYDLTPPAINFTSPSETSGAVLNRKFILVNVTANDTNLANITIKLYNSTGLKNSTTALTSPDYLNFSSLADGIYYFNATACDIVSNCNSTETRNVTIDTVAPLISIIYPANQTYNYTVSALNYTVSGAQSCWYYNGTANATITCGNNLTGLTSVEGSNTWIVYANNSAGNLNSSSVIFVKDTVAPSISMISPANGKNYNNLTLLVNISTSGAQSIWFFNGTANETYANPVYRRFSEGSNTIYAYANDSAGNFNHASSTFYIDTTKPAVNIISPENRTYANRTVGVEITATNIADTSVDTIWYGWNGTNITYTIPINVTFNESSNILYAYANDTVGNIGNSSVMFSTDTIYPTISIAYPANQTYNYNVNALNYTVSGAQSCWYYNGTANATITCGNNLTGLTSAEGSNTWIVYANDSAGNLNSSRIIFSKDTIAPVITIYSPANTTYSNRTILVNFTADSYQTLWFYNGTGNTTYTAPVYRNANENSNTWIFYANDSVNNVNTTSRTFSLDTISPLVSIAYPQNVTYTSNVSALNYTVSGAQSCWYSLNNGQTNITALNCANITGLASVEGNNTWRIYANDSAGNLNSSSVTFLKDMIPPVITVYSPLNQTYSNRTILVNFTADSYQNLWFYNGTNNVTYTSSGYVNVSEGSHTFIFYANESSGNLNQTPITFSVDTIAPLISITYPANISYNVNVSNLNYTVSGAQTCWYYNGTANATITCGNNLTGLTSAEGSNTWIVYANDSAGNVNSSSVTFIKDMIPPVITIYSPLNQTYSNRTILVNFTADSYQTLWFYNGTGNTTYTNSVYMNANENSNTWIFYANESSGNFNQTSAVFSIDTIAPLISITYPANTAYNLNVSELNYTVSGAQSCWYYNGTANATITCGNNLTGLTSAEGSNTWIVYANDSAGNVNSSSIMFVKDTLNPSVSILYPQNQTYNINVSALNYTASDANLQTCWYSLNFGVTNITISNCTNVTGLTSTEGSNTWKVYANDPLGNSNSSSVTFFKDTIIPLIQFVSPTTETGNYSQNSISLNVTATDTNLDKIIVYLYNSTGLFNSIFTASGIFINFTNLPDGKYYLNATANDTARNSNSTETRAIILDTTKPSVQFVSPTETSGSYINRNSVIINITVTDANLKNITIRLYNSTSLVNSSSTTASALYTNFSSLDDGIYYFNATSFDNAINSNSTETRTVTIDRVAPTFNTAQTRPVIGKLASIFENISLIINATDNNAVSNVTAGIRWNSTSQSILLVFNATSSFYEGEFTNTSLLGNYNITFTAIDIAGNSNTTLTNFTVLDSTPPVITSHNISNYAPIVNETLFLNMSATDNLQVDRLFANITLPDGSSQIIYLPAYHNATMAGRYNITFIANDTFGNNAASATDYFIAGSNATIQFNVIDSNSSGVQADLTIYLAGTDKEVHLHGFNGIYVDSHAALIYDLVFKAYNKSIEVRLNNVNISLDNNKTLGIDKLTVSGFLATFGVNNTYTISNATVKLNYTGLSYSNENNLSVYKCSDWNFSGGECLSEWLFAASAKNTSIKILSVDTTGFSAFSIKEEVATVSVPYETRLSGGGGAIVPCRENWQCTEWDCTNGFAYRQCHDVKYCNTTYFKPEEKKECVLIQGCFDRKKNNNETDIDCGGNCPACLANQNCISDKDCTTGFCYNGICRIKEMIEKPAPITLILVVSWWIWIALLLVVLALLLALNVIDSMIKPTFHEKMHEYIRTKKEHGILKHELREAKAEEIKAKHEKLRPEKRVKETSARLIEEMKKKPKKSLFGWLWSRAKEEKIKKPEMLGILEKEVKPIQIKASPKIIITSVIEELPEEKETKKMVDLRLEKEQPFTRKEISTAPAKPKFKTRADRLEEERLKQEEIIKMQKEIAIEKARMLKRHMLAHAAQQEKASTEASVSLGKYKNEENLAKLEKEEEKVNKDAENILTILSKFKIQPGKKKIIKSYMLNKLKETYK